MALNYTVGMLFEAKDMATEVMRRIEKQFGSLGEKAKAFGANLAGAFGAFKGAEFGSNVIHGMLGLAKGAGEFEMQLGLLNATAQASKAEMKAFDEKSMSVGMHSMFSAKQAAEGMTEMVSAGMNARAALKGVDDALVMATASAGKLSMGQIGEFLGNISNSFPGENDTKRVVNMVAQVANMSSVGFDKIPAMYAKVNRGSLSMNQTLESASAMLALFKNATNGAEEASTSLGMTLQALSTKPKNITLFEAATGVKVFDKVANKFRQLPDVFVEMAKSPKWNALGGDQQNAVLAKVFESRQVGKVIASLNQIMTKGFEDPLTKIVYKGEEGMRRMIQALTDSTKNGVAQRFVDEQEGIFNGAMKRLTTKWNNTSIIIGRAFGNVFGPAVRAIDAVLEQVGDLILAIPAPVRNAAAAFLVGAVAAGTLTFAVLAGVFAFKALAIAAGFFGLTLSGVLLPLLPIIGAVAAAWLVLIAVGASFAAAWQGNIGGIASTTAGFVEKIKLAFSVFKQLFSEGGTWGEVHKEISDPKNSGLLTTLMGIWMWLGRIKVFAVSVWESFSQGMNESGMVDAFVSLVEIFLSLFSIGKTSTKENISAWEKWAEVGRSVGRIMLVIAKVGLGSILFVMTAIVAVVGAFKAIWWTIGPLVLSVVQMVWGAIQALIGVVVALFTLNFDMLGEGIMNVIKGVVSFVLNFVGTFAKIIASLIDGAAALGGKDLNLRGSVDTFFRENEAGFQTQKLPGASSANPGISAARGQAAAAANPPAITIQPTNVIMNANGEAIASGSIQWQHDTNRRSMMSGPTANSMLER